MEASSSKPVPGLPPGNDTINGVSLHRPLPKTCGPACTVSPLYVLLNLESPRPADALRALPSVIAEHSGHTTVYLVLDVPSAKNGRLFFELHGYWKPGQGLSSSPGPAETALEEVEYGPHALRCNLMFRGFPCYKLLYHEDDCISIGVVKMRCMCGHINHVDRCEECGCPHTM
jgi:hypothetical protein